MGYTKELLLARLQELQIDFAQYEHPVVLTVEAQANYVGHLGGALSKNLFLKDKKHRFYMVSALADTKVDMKVLSQRLGLGKGGLRMAPEEALGEILQVPLGCVTPFALVNESARSVSLLLDQGFRNHDRCFFHPLSNDMTISLSAQDLDKFLSSIGRDPPAYIDVEANPAVGKDQPPDLAYIVPADAISLPHSVGKAAAVSSHDNESMKNKPATAPAKAMNQSNDMKTIKEKTANVAPSSSSFANTEKFVGEILDKASSLVLSDITEDVVKQHGDQLGAIVSSNIKKRLNAELNSLAMIFKNAAYTEGFNAGVSHHPMRH